MQKWSIAELLYFIDMIEKRMCFGFKELSIDDKERLDEIRYILKERKVI